MFGPHHCLRRGTSAPNSEILRRLLQLSQNASVFAQGCTGFSACSAIRHHNVKCPPWRTSLPKLPGLGFSVHTGCMASRIREVTVYRRNMTREVCADEIAKRFAGSDACGGEHDLSSKGFEIEVVQRLECHNRKRFRSSVSTNWFASLRIISTPPRPLGRRPPGRE